jgi:hypothetical protein
MIIKKTAFCSKVTCCPTISIDTETAEVTITDDYDGVLVANREIFLRANFFARKLSENRLSVSGSAVFCELEYTFAIENCDKYTTLYNYNGTTHETKSTDILISQQYYLSLEYKEQKVKGITLEQWNILADAVYKSFEPVTFILDEELVNV